MYTTTTCNHCHAIITEDNEGYVDEVISECHDCMEFQDDLFAIRHGAADLVIPETCPEL